MPPRTERERERKRSPPAAADFLRSFNAAIIGIRLGRVYWVQIYRIGRGQVTGSVLTGYKTIVHTSIIIVAKW